LLAIRSLRQSALRMSRQASIGITLLRHRRIEFADRE
jgi:hypothetical protein